MIFKAYANFAEQAMRAGFCAFVSSADYVSRSARSYSEHGEAFAGDLAAMMATRSRDAITHSGANPAVRAPRNNDPRSLSALGENAATSYLRTLSDLCVAPMASFSLFDGLVGQTQVDRSDANQWPPQLFRVNDREVTLPVRFWASQGIAMYLVDAQVAQQYVPDHFRCYTMNSKAVVALRITDYLSSDLGPYFEIDMAFGVLDRASTWPVPGTFALQMLVTSPFARDAGHTIWGYPKIVAPLEIIYKGVDAARCNVLNDKGDLSIQISMARVHAHLPVLRSLFLATPTKSEKVLERVSFAPDDTKVWVLDRSGVEVQVYDDEYVLGRAIKALKLHQLQPMFHLWTDEMSATLEHPFALAHSHTAVAPKGN